MPPAPEQQTQLRLRALAALLDGQNIGVLHQTPDHRFDLALHLPPMWLTSKVLGMQEADFMSEVLAGQFSAAVTRCLELQQSQCLEFELPHGARTSVYRAQVLLDDDGVLTLLSDVTDERGREAALASLLREVSHRSKNLLAIVQSVAMQTAHHSGDVGEFLGKFRGRLHALSSTQDLVTESNWRGTHLHALISSQIARVGQVVLRNVRIVGADPLLSPNAALHLGLAIHELAVNATSHGALAVGNAGTVQVSATFSLEDGCAPSLNLEWLETGLRPQKEQGEPRFGMLVLERIVPLSVAGTATFSIADDRLIYRLSLPGDQFEA